MALSSEVIVGVVSLIVTCPPVILFVWNCIRRRRLRNENTGTLLLY